ARIPVPLVKSWNVVALSVVELKANAALDGHAPVCRLPNKKACETGVAVLRFEQFFLTRRSIWKFHRGAIVNYVCSNHKLVEAQIDCDRTLCSAIDDNGFKCLLNRKFQPGGNIAPRAPSAGAAFYERCHLAEHWRGRVNCRRHAPLDADTKHEVEAECDQC